MGITFIRTIILFLVLIVSLRFMGKRQLGELEPIELVVAVLISDLASQPLQDTGTPLLYGLVPVLTLLSCQVIVSGLAVKNIKLRRLLCGKPSILINNGRIVQNEMKKNRIALDELAVELRLNGITDISAVQHAILETNGKLSVLLYADQSPATPSQMSLAVSDAGLPVTVISEGRVLNDNLRLLGRDRRWLEKQLSSRRISGVREVYLMTVDKNGAIYLAEKEKNK